MVFYIFFIIVNCKTFVWIIINISDEFLNVKGNIIISL